MTQSNQQKHNLSTLMLGGACTVLTSLIGGMFMWAVSTLGEMPVLNAKLTEQISTLTKSVNSLQVTLANLSETSAKYRRETMIQLNTLELRVSQLEKDIQRKGVK